VLLFFLRACHCEGREISTKRAHDESRSMDQADKVFTDGESYERLMGRWSRLVGEGFLDWLDVPIGLRWLDVGCGNGAFTEEIIARRAPAAVTAIDPSEDQLAYARARASAKIADFQVGDAQKLAFGDGSFDVAIMALVISFLPDPDKAAAEMARVARPGGWVASYMWDIPGGGTPVDAIYVSMESMGMTSVRPLNPAVSRREVMQELWEKAGLASVETQVIRIPVTYSSFDDFWDSNTVPIGPQGKLIDRMSNSAREHLRTLVRQRLPVGPDGRIAYEGLANAVKGRVRA
jgi:ubiquinone/menaquinone biosynthesis C-methylase UbiE